MLHLSFGVLNIAAASLLYFMDYLPFFVRKDLPEETENFHNSPHFTPGLLFTTY